MLQLPLQPTQAIGPRVAVTLSQAGLVFDRTSILVNEQTAATARLRPHARDLDGVRLCFAVVGRGQAGLIGGLTPPGIGELTSNGEPAGASITVAYREKGTASWWGRMSRIFDRMALGRGDWGGHWIPWTVGALLLERARARRARARARPRRAARQLAAGGRGDRRRGDRLNAVAWSLITPAFQVPDEQTHVAYAQQLAENGRPPVDRRGDGTTRARAGRGDARDPLRRARRAHVRRRGHLAAAAAPARRRAARRPGAQQRERLRRPGGARAAALLRT